MHLAENPNGIPTQSPGLRGTSYPGIPSAQSSTPTGLRLNPKCIVHPIRPGSSCGQNARVYERGPRGTHHASSGPEEKDGGLWWRKRDECKRRKGIVACGKDGELRRRFPIPKGLCPSAQGCEERATLGNRRRKFTTPTGLWRTSGATAEMGMAATPLGLLPFADVHPG